MGKKSPVVKRPLGRMEIVDDDDGEKDIVLCFKRLRFLSENGQAVEKPRECAEPKRQ